MADPTTSSTTKCGFTMYGDLAAAAPFSGTGQFGDVTGGIPGMNYSETTWATDASAAAGFICVTETKKAEEKKVEEKKVDDKKADDKATAAKPDDKATEKTDAPATAATSSYSARGLAFVYGKHVMGLYAPKYVDSKNVFKEDASMGLSTEYVGFEYTEYLGSSGLSLGAKGMTGLSATCDSTGDFGSLDCDSGTILTSTAGDFYLGKDSYSQVKGWMMGGALTVAWDPIDTFAGLNNPYANSRHLSGGGIKVLAQVGALGQIGYDPFSDGSNTVKDSGGTHIYNVDVGGGQTRPFASTWTPDGMQTWASVGVRVEGNPLNVFKKRKPADGQHFLGYEIAAPKEEKKTAPGL